MGKNKTKSNVATLINLVLINESFKALRYGEYVEADETSGEFILDFDNSESLPAKATLMEIATKNKISIENKKGTKDEIAAELQQGLSAMNIPSQNEKSESAIVAEIVEAGVKAGKGDEEMIVEIITSGIKFKAAGRMFAKAMAESGYRISTKERKERIEQILNDAEFEPENYDDVEEMIQVITTGKGKVPETTESQALRAIKGFLKEAEIEMPKAVKKPKGGFRKQVQDFVIENPLVTKKEFFAKVEEMGKEEKVASRMWPQIEFAQSVANATIALADQEIEDEDDES